MTIDQYNPEDKGSLKEWKAEFRAYLYEYYKPSVVSAEKIFNSIPNANRTARLIAPSFDLIKTIDKTVVLDIRQKMLSYHPFAFGHGISSSDTKILVIDRYCEFIDSKIQESTNAGSNDEDTIQNEDVIEKATEGMSMEVTFFRRKRNRAIRDVCARNANYTCYVCGMNFEQVYGERGRNFIEVHHLKPLSSYEGEHDIPLAELCALCSNCHSMVHHGKELMDVDELKNEYIKNKHRQE